jgi:peptidoglycan/LPS O-acetylase OafA/YrhL
LLYKMFDNRIIGSYGYQLWFISTIVQFYLIFPILVWVKQRVPDLLLFLLGLAVSIGWGLIMLGLGHVNRSWGSAFLLYLWEFLLGMIFAERFYSTNFRFWEIRVSYLILLAVGGIAAYGLMALTLGKYGELLNDLPALIGFTCLSILIYDLGIGVLNRFILFVARISYPLFLVHFLVLRIVIVVLHMKNLTFNWIAAVATLGLCFLAALGFEKVFGKVSDLLFRQRRVAAGG